MPIDKASKGKEVAMSLAGDEAREQIRAELSKRKGEEGKP